MIVFPNAKINLGLQVMRKRTDGYHDIETVFYPVPLYDILEVILTDSRSTATVFPSISAEIQSEATNFNLKSGIVLTYSSSGIPIEGPPERNLCIQACELFDEQYGLPGDLSIHLHKIIPMGAGLGGGSSDAAFMLKALAELAGIAIAVDELHKMASVLGSDCSFFIVNSPVHASGRGEILQPIQLSLEGYKLVIVKPQVHVSTKVAFEGIQPNSQNSAVFEVIAEPISSWQGKLFNDFEKSLFPKYSKIADIKKLLLKQGAIYASMTGSGSAVYGLFKDNVPHNNLVEDCFYFQCHFSK